MVQRQHRQRVHLDLPTVSEQRRGEPIVDDLDVGECTGDDLDPGRGQPAAVLVTVLLVRRRPSDATWPDPEKRM